MLHENTFKKVDFNGAKGLVFLGDKILTYRRDNKTNNSPLCIDLPGGGREEDESPFDTFKREIKEEFGIDIEKNDIKFSCTVQSVIESNKKSYFVVAILPKIKASDVVFGNEGVEWMLMSPQEFINRHDGIHRQQKRVEKYLAGKLLSE
jgi:8-oxo-dGTP diphosphatase